jgi:hypothetical protein
LRDDDSDIQIQAAPAAIQLLFGCYLDRICSSDAVYGIAQDFFSDDPLRSDATSGAIGGFLDYMSVVPARPFPYHFVSRYRFVESRPPVVVRLPSKAAAHRFNHVTRVGKQVDSTSLTERFESQCGRRDLSLLICGLTQIGADRAPYALITKQRYRSRASRDLAVPKARSIAKDRDLL